MVSFLGVMNLARNLMPDLTYRVQYIRRVYGYLVHLVQIKTLLKIESGSPKVFLQGQIAILYSS